jgi:hypothetical protein
MSIVRTAYAFTPIAISNCALWLDGADPAGTGVVPASGTLSTWVDKSRSGNNAIAYTGATAPSYSSTTSNVTFGTNYYYISGISSAPANETLFMVLRRTSSATNTPYGSSVGSGATWYMNNTDPSFIAWNPYGQGNSSGANLLFYNNVTNIVCGTNSSGTNVMYLNGTADTAGSTSFSSSGIMTIGTSSSGTNGALAQNGFVGTISEVIFYSFVLGTSQRQQVEAYLAQKWGATSSLVPGHPGLTTRVYRSDYLVPNKVKPTPYYTQFSPTKIAGCALWLDGSQETSGNGTSLSTITDRSNSGNSVTASGTITVASSFLGGLTVYNFSNSRAYVNNFPWQTSFTQIVLVKCSIGNWLSSLWNGGYLAYVFSGNWTLEYVSGFYANDSSIAQGTSVFSSTPGGVTAWAIFVCGYQSGATSVSNYSINGTIRTSQTGPAYSGTLPTTAQLWLNGNGNGSFDTSYVAEFLHYNSVLSSTQVQQIESYLAQKWGLISSLPGSHSHFTQQAGAVTTVANTKFKVVGLPRFVYASTGLVITHQDGRPWKVSGTGQGSSIGLNTGTAMSLTIYAGSDVFNSAGGRVGLFDNGNINNAVRHAGYVMWTYTFAANNFDFAWKFVSSGSGYLIYNDYPSYSSWQVSYDPAQDRVLIVPPSDGKYGMVWNITPKVSLAYVYSSY